jgi:hypothetical protein
MKSPLRSLLPFLAASVGALTALPGPAVADDEDDDTSTDNLGDQKGSDRVDASESKVDRSNSNAFEKERFFIDKIDTRDTEEKTLFQGNIISSTFFYSESGGGKLPTNNTNAALDPGTTNSEFSRLFTDLRLQLDARHIAGGRWLSRVDVRGRAATDPAMNTPSQVYGGDANTRVQSGLTGESELEIKELWIARPGDRYDVFFGRQLIPDLGAIKIDGVRIDYAKSDRVTLLGFAGAYPLRGSRSIGTDYPNLRDDAGKSLGRTPPISAGAGAAYRTPLSYGSLGGGVVAPIKGGETPRVFVTSTGYTRTGPKLDLYHFALIDVASEGGFGINNLSGGLNYRPTPSLRATASINHVDTETLEVQARTFLEPTDASLVRNDTQVRRIASTQVQGGLSASFGRNQQIEASVALSGRYRPDVDVNYTTGGMTSTYTFTAAKSMDVYAQLVHRNLFSTRVGVDFVRSYSIGEASARSAYYTFRGFLSREFRQGRGSWEGELAYSNSKDEVENPGPPMQTLYLYGKSKTSTLSAAGTVYYRLRSAWFLMGSAGIGSFGLETIALGTKKADPSTTTLSLFARLAYRF